MIIENIHRSLDDGRVKHAAELVSVLRRFLQHHPEAAEGMAAIVILT